MGLSVPVADGLDADIGDGATVAEHAPRGADLSAPSHEIGGDDAIEPKDGAGEGPGEGSLSRAKAAEFLDCSVSTLNAWAAHDFGPEFFRWRGRTFYPIAGLRAWRQRERRGR